MYYIYIMHTSHVCNKVTWFNFDCLKWKFYYQITACYETTLIVNLTWDLLSYWCHLWTLPVCKNFCETMWKPFLWIYVKTVFVNLCENCFCESMWKPFWMTSSMWKQMWIYVKTCCEPMWQQNYLNVLIVTGLKLFWL